MGYLGGPDSITLLNLIYSFKEKFDIEIFAAHINHGIREEAINDEEYVKEYCEERNIPFFVKRVNVNEIAKQEKISTEMAGRNVRYDFFEEVLEKVDANKIAIAHTASDNAETVLMNLFRGTGISGLKGIEPKRGNKYIRPLIECTRKEIEEYAEENELNPCIDKTNFENIYTRNKIRNQIIPTIQENFNPNIVQTLNRLSSIVQEEEEYWKQTIPNKYNEILVKEEIENNKKIVSMNLKKFQKFEPFLQSKIILYSIEKVCGTTQRIEKVHIEDIRKMCQKNIGNKRLMPYKGLVIEVKDKLINVMTM